MGKEGKPTQGFVIKPVTFMDNWGSIPLEPSKEPCRTSLRTVHPRDNSSLGWLREWEHFFTNSCPPLVKGCPLGY